MRVDSRCEFGICIMSPRKQIEPCVLGSSMLRTKVGSQNKKLIFDHFGVT